MLLRLLALTALAAWCPAAEVGGVTFTDSTRVGDDELPLRGAGVIRRYFIKVHACALWLPPGAGALDDVPKRYELHYFHDIAAADFVSATEQTIDDNASPAELAALRERIDAYNRLYIDVKEGERYCLTYRPGLGTELSHQGRVLGVIPGVDFQRALFAIWLGADPLDDELKRSLLGL